MLFFRAIFSSEGVIPALCGDIGVCPPVRNGDDVEVTCDMCMHGIDMLAMVFQSDKNVVRLIDLLIGDAFCTVSLYILLFLAFLNTICAFSGAKFWIWPGMH